MANLLEELATWFGANVSGVTLWDEAAETGNLFRDYMPDFSKDANVGAQISIGFDGKPMETGIPGKYKQKFVVVGQGAGNETEIKAMHSWLWQRGAGRTFPPPFSLTNFEVQKAAMEGRSLSFFDTGIDQTCWTFSFSLIYYES